MLLLKISESQGAGELPCAFQNSLPPQCPKLSRSPEDGTALQGPRPRLRASRELETSAPRWPASRNR